MIEAVASGILSTLSVKLGSMLMKELRSLKDVDKDLKMLESTLSDIQNVLADAEACQVKEKSIQGWLKKLKNIAYEIDDVLDQAVVQALNEPMVRNFSSPVKSLTYRPKIAKDIKDIRERLAQISEDKSRFQLSEQAAEPYDEYIGRRETGSFIDISRVYGRDEDKKHIIDFLLDKSNKTKLGVVSIFGLGGIGKTTLAQLVYNDRRVSRHFQTKIWVHVSHKFDIKKVMTSIIESITKRKFELSSRDSTEKELLKQIKKKRFLLVLDDVWTEVSRPWDELKSLLSNGSATGSKVIVTTRDKRVASVAMKSNQLHQLKILRDDEYCWKLFENAFRPDSNLVDIGREIVKKCGGLPLAIMTFGSALYLEKEVSKWQEIRDNQIWTQFEKYNDLLASLKLSYSHLKSPLKQCFAYCSIFPKGREININMLTQLWIAEGFIGSSNGSKCVDTFLLSKEYVDTLISTSLFENAAEDGCVKMHDMVHNLARFVAGDECSIIDATNSSNTNVSQNSRYASFILNEVKTLPTHMLSNKQKLRTFHLSSDRPYYSCQQVLETIVSSTKLLRTLHLPGLAIKELSAMTKLIHLRYLNLSNTNLNSLPKTIGKLCLLQHLDLSCTNLQELPTTIGTLYHLQTLNLSGCMKLKKLPESISDLANLLTLILHNCYSLHFLPDSISKLVHLQHLDLSRTNLQTLPSTIDTLQNLKTLDLSNCEVPEKLLESICDLSKNLLTLNLSSCKSLHSLPCNIGYICNLRDLSISNIDALEVLPESLSSLRNLQRLDLSYCGRLHELPKNIQSMSSLTHLEIYGCDSLTSMPKGIGQLTKLQGPLIYVLGDKENSASLAELGTLMNLNKKLHLKNLQNVRKITEATTANLREKQSIDSLVLEWDFDVDWTSSEYKSIDDFEEKMKTLKKRVVAMDAEHANLLEDALSSLQPHHKLRDLQLKSYVGKKLPAWMMDLSNLVNLRLESFAGCDNLKELEKLSCLEDLKLERFPSIEYLPRLGQLPRLRRLSLCMLPGVKCLGPELYGDDAAFPSLKSLELRYMLGLEKWLGNANEGGNDFLPHLSTLDLRGCRQLQKLPPTFPSVVELKINADDELSYIGCVEFPKLNELLICKCIDTEDESSKVESSMPEVLAKPLHYVALLRKEEKLIKWNRSKMVLEKMRLDTLQDIAVEIEKKKAHVTQGEK